MKHYTQSSFLLLKLILIVSIVYTFSRCQKENIPEEQSVERKLSFDKSLDNIPIIKNPYVLDEHIINPNDPDDENVSQQLIEIGLLIRDLFKDNRLNKIIMSEATKYANDCISIENFIMVSESSAGNENKYVYEKLKQLFPTINLVHRSLNPDEIGKIEYYIPAIFAINNEKADYSKIPFISPGVYVNENLPGMDKYEDYMIFWYLNYLGEFEEILMSEETASNTTNPIFIMDNAEELISKRLKAKNNPIINVEKDQETSIYSSNEFKINNRYENTGNSEFWITAAHINENGGLNTCLQSGSGVGVWRKEIRSVSSGNIGVQLSHWEQFCSNNVTPFTSNFVYFNTYEHDWGHSKKDLGTVAVNQNVIDLEGNRKWSSEWYAFDPSQLSSNRVDLSYIYGYWAKWHSNYKGNLRLWRVEP